MPPEIESAAPSVKEQSGLAYRLTAGRTWLAWVLILGLINGLLFVFSVPPWQHYDEPNHFEYVWLVARRGSIPQPGEYDPGMRRAVAESMIAHGFYTPLGFLPDLDAPDGDIWIGQYPQTGDPPLYYLWAALPVRLLQDRASVTTQLYAARLSSLLLFLLTLVAACGITAELVRPRHPLRVFLPLSLVLLPAFVDLMTAVNNDVAAVAVFSWFLWGAVRLIQRGLNWRDLLWSLIFALAGLVTRQTAYSAILLWPLAVLLAWYRQAKPGARKLAWAAGGLLLLVGLGVLLARDDAAGWYRETLQAGPDRVETRAAPQGQYALRLTTLAGEAPGRLVQILPYAAAGELAGKQVTLGAWIWADQPLEIRSPEIYVYARGKGYSRPISITTQPQFFAFTIRLGRETHRTWVILSPGAGRPEETRNIYYDGLVLAEGAFPAGEPPVFTSTRADSGTWGGVAFTNYLRNASAESAGLRVRPWVDGLGERLLPETGFERLSLTLYTVLDRPAAGYYYLETFKNLGRTFWAVFGWNGIYLPGSNPYRPLAWITVLGLLGAMLAGWHYRRQLPWSVILLFAVALIAVWGFAMLRGSNYIFMRLGFLPAARYVYPAVVPAMLAFTGGWVYLLEQSLGKWLRQTDRNHLAWLAYLPLGVFLAGLNIYCLVSIVRAWQSMGVL